MWGDRQPDDWITVGDAERFMSDNQQHREIQTAALHTLYDQNLSIFEQNSRLRHPKEWEKWGKEVTTIIERRKQTKALEAADFDEAIQMVRANHIDEIAEERAQQMLTTMPASEGAGVVAGTTPENLDNMEIPENWKQMYRENGLIDAQGRPTQTTIDSCKKRQISVEKFFKMMENHQVVKDGPNIYKAYDLDVVRTKEPTNG